MVKRRRSSRPAAALVALSLGLSACSASGPPAASVDVDDRTGEGAPAADVSVPDPSAESAGDSGGSFSAEPAASPSRAIGSIDGAGTVADPAGGTTPPGSSADPSATTASTLAPVVDEVDVLMADLMRFVEDERGHDFLERPPLTLLDSDDFAAAFATIVDRDAERHAEDFANFTDIYRAMGIIDGTRTLEEIWVLFGDAGALGYYDHDDQSIVLRGGEVTALTRTILVHELTHALDDQIFDIDRPEYDDRDDEIGWTLSAIVEGNAQYIEARYRATMTDAERAEEIEVQRNLPRGVSLSIFTPSFLELQFSRYDHGLDLAEALWAEGRNAVDEALTSPPVTSELVVDAAQYLAGTPPDPAVTPPQADGAVFESGVWGQIGWEALFADVDPDRAAATAMGWGGDFYVAWRSGDRTCVRIHVAADTAADLDQFADMIERWAVLGDRQVFYPSADLVRVTSCG